MILVGENKSILCKGDFRPAALFKGDKKIAGYTVEEFAGTGSVVLENCYNDNVQNITVRGKNYFDLDKVPFSNNTTQPYNNGLKAQKTSVNRGNKIPISLPVGKEIYMTMDVVDSQINGTATYVTVGFFDSSDTHIYSRTISSGIAHKSYSFTLSKEVSYIQFFFQADDDKNAVGDYITMDNIMLRTEGDDSFEPYIEPHITVRGKNYFDLDKVPFNKSTTQPYNNGLTAKKTAGNNRGNKIPISLPVGKTIYMTMDVVDSQIGGTITRVSLGFIKSDGTSVGTTNVSSTVAHKSYTFTLSEEVSYIQFYFQSADDRNAVGDYVTMDNIMLRTEGDDSFELYIEPQTIPFENGELTADIPTFKGTTVIEIESDIPATISGKYKKVEV